jgi:N-methylhydantoinase A
VGHEGELLIATSSGGVTTPGAIARRAVATIGSGPTGGVVAATRAAADAGIGDSSPDHDGVVTVDMGGTSFDVCLVRGGRPELNAEWNWRHRYCIALPMVDIHSVGAGGGSIARAIDGSLTVGPESAGSNPGPVCYGRGGTQPTVTDADLLLGRLDPATFWGGRLALDVDAATTALAGLGAELELDLDDVAVAIATLVDAHATDAIRRVLSLAGADPRRLDLVAFGGMGGVHGAMHAAALGMRRVLVPDAAPAFSALGLLSADHVVDAAHALVGPWATIDLDELTGHGDALQAAALDELSAAGVPAERVHLEWYLNLVYPGQTFENRLPLVRRPGTPIGRTEVADAVEEFHRRNEAARLIEARAQEPTVRGIRLVAIGEVDKPARHPIASGPLPAPITKRRVHTGDAWHDAVSVYDGDTLPADVAIEGPAVVQRRFTTLLLRAGDVARVLPSGDVVIDLAP